MAVSLAEKTKEEERIVRKMYLALKRLQRIVRKYEGPLSKSSNYLSRTIRSFDELFRHMRALTLHTTQVNLDGAKKALENIKNQIKDAEQEILEEEARMKNDKFRAAAIEKLEVDLSKFNDEQLKDNVSYQITKLNDVIDRYNKVKNDLINIYEDCKKIMEFIKEEEKFINMAKWTFEQREGRSKEDKVKITHIATKQFLKKPHEKDFDMADRVARRDEIKEAKESYDAAIHALHEDREAIDCIHQMQEILNSIQASFKKEFEILEQEEARSKAA